MELVLAFIIGVAFLFGPTAPQKDDANSPPAINRQEISCD